MLKDIKVIKIININVNKIFNYIIFLKKSDDRKTEKVQALVNLDFDGLFISIELVMCLDPDTT